MAQLPPTHFLSLPRPDILFGPPAGVPDTTTLAAHDFDVDTRTGFMPPQPPLRRLGIEWEPWEVLLDDAISQRLQLGSKPDLPESERQKSESWRERVRNLPILPIDELKNSEITLRRAHLVLSWIMHFYVHSLPPSDPVRIPPPLTLPLLQVSAQLQLPPVVTYSDDVLYNFYLEETESSESDTQDILPTESNIRCLTTFTSTNDEAEFYLTSGRMELAGVEALELMRSTMDEAFVGDDIAIRRITEYLHQMVEVIHRLKAMLLDVKGKCDPHVFYNEIRPWFRGEDSQSGQKWVFEGIEQDPTLSEPHELSGPSAGQSSLIHAIDTFLGVDQYSHHQQLTGHHPQEDDTLDVHTASASSSIIPYQKSAFLQRMQLYMPRHHRAFLTHLANNPRPLRNLVLQAAFGDSEDGEAKKRGAALLEAYNAAVTALKEFRDAHMIIVALYIIGPARRAKQVTAELQGKKDDEKGVVEAVAEAATAPLKGTGGTDMVRFLKSVRDQTKEALLSVIT